MRILRAATYRRMPWKNGGGETTEIGVSPPGADFAALDWRLSMARVAADGPFSSFPGLDRTLCVLAGALRLDIDGEQVDLAETSAPFAFPGEAVTHGCVLRGPVDDLNVMTRRDRFAHEVRPLAVSGETHLELPPGIVLLFCHTGTLHLGPAETLQALDTGIFDESDCRPLSLHSRDGARGYLIVIAPRPLPMAMSRA